MSQNLGWEETVARFELKEKIKALQKSWQKKCEDVLPKLCLQDVKKHCVISKGGGVDAEKYQYYNDLAQYVMVFLKTLYETVDSANALDDDDDDDVDVDDNNKSIIERHVYLNATRFGCEANFYGGNYFLGLVHKYNLETKHGEILKQLKKYFGKDLAKDYRKVNTLRGKEWKGLDELDHDLR